MKSLGIIIRRIPLGSIVVYLSLKVLPPCISRQDIYRNLIQKNNLSANTSESIPIINVDAGIIQKSPDENETT